MVPDTPVRAEPRTRPAPLVSVIVPARNEEAALGACLASIVGQEGISKDVIVVDDASTDRTAAIAASFPGVRVVPSRELPADWSGKCNAVWTGAQLARGEWLLFTDADTVHLPGSLAYALHEAQEHKVELLSYSPEQEVHGLLQWAVMPLIFAELACAYPPQQVCDPASAIAAANGQYLLISHRAYDAAGGHAAVAPSLLEDLELAKRVKAAGHRIRLRHGKGLVRTRMYRDSRSLVEGWTKNLSLLFPNARKLAFSRLAEFAAMAAAVCMAVATLTRSSVCSTLVAPDVGATGWICNRELVLAIVGLGAWCWLRVLKRVRRAHFGLRADLLVPLGLPIFSYLLLRSRFYYKWRKQIQWKGRAYCPSNPRSPNPNVPGASSPSGAPSSI